MPELIEQMYCSQQIVIPPKFPYILKRYCKAAIKTQPYDLLRWSFEYFKALSERRAPPVKLRLEYPVYSTEGGLTRGCLKVLANQLAGIVVIPLSVVKLAWQGFCLDPAELRRILCLCEAHLRSDSVLFLHFIAVAGGLLTKSLTHTMILLCETLTKEPDGGSAAIPLHDFLIMYKYLARMDASMDVKFINGYKEGIRPGEEEEVAEEEEVQHEEMPAELLSDDFWQEARFSNCELQRLTLTNDVVARSTTISTRANEPLIGKIERSPSVERATAIERENFMMDRKGRAGLTDETSAKITDTGEGEDEAKGDGDESKKEKVEQVQDYGVEINVYDEDENPVQWEIYGAPFEVPHDEDEDEVDTVPVQSVMETKIQSTLEVETPEDVPSTEKEEIRAYVEECYQIREERRADLLEAFDEIAILVDRFMSANYDLGMVAGRQMSTTSGEFIVHQIEKEILEFIDEQIAILPDPDLKKKKAKPEEVAMIRDLLMQFLDDNMDIICPEVEEVEEEEEPVPDVVMVYAVPGIGESVDVEIIKEFEEYATEVAKVQADVFMPRNIRHFMCPPMEKYVEFIYEKKKEEIPTVGIITD